MKTLLPNSRFFTIVFLFVSLLFASVSFGQILTSDQPDYAPGSTATFTGSGFFPGEEVKLQVLHADETPDTGEDHGTWYVTADENGNFITTWHVCEDDCLGSTLRAMASGQTSGLYADVVFTDASSTTIAITSGTNPTCSGSSVTFTATKAGGSCTPSFQWKKNGIDIAGATSSSYNTTALANGDVISVFQSVGTGGCSAALSTNAITMTVNSGMPATPGAITLSANTCSGSGRVFSISAVSGATSYIWSVTGVGWAVTAGGTTTSATITIGSGVGTVSVTATNACGSSSASTTGNITPTVVPATPGVITQPITKCVSSIGNIFSILDVAGATSYAWSVTGTGWSVTAGQGTTSVSITIGSGVGTVSVTATNICGTSLASTTGGITPTALPTANLTPNSASICQGESVTLEIALTGSGTISGTLNDGTPFSSATGNVSIVKFPTADITYTIATLTNGTCTGTFSGSTAVTIKGKYTSDVGIDKTICPGLPLLLSGVVTGTSPTLLWTTSGTGTFSSTSSLTPTYTPSVTDVAVGSVILSLKVSGTGACDATDTMVLTIGDVIAPTVIAQDITVQLDGSGNAAIIPSQINNGSTDNCGIDTYALDIDAFTCANVGTPVTVTLTVTDIHGNSDSKTAEVTVEDKIAPTFSCSASVVRVFDLNQIYYTILNSEFNVTPTDNCSIATLSYTLSEATTGSGSGSLAGVQLNGGLTRILWKAVDVSGNVFECFFNVTVNKRPTTIVYTGDLTEQYSDQQTLKAILKDQITNTPLSGKTVGFTIGTQSVSDGPGLPYNGTDGSGVAEANLVLVQAPGDYNVISSFAEDATYLSSSNTSNLFTINKENVDVTYTGLPYFSTASATSCNATVTLSATIKDITALGGSGDIYSGDIRNAKVTFRLGNPTTGAILGTSDIPVVLVSAGNTMIGTVSTTFNYTLSSTDCANKGATLDVYAVVNNYYKGDNCLDPGSVTISVPGSESVTGGGFLKMQSSLGTYAGTTGAKTNFGFTMKWTKTGTNVKGQANIIIRRNGRVYQIKSNAISSLSVSGSSGNFVTKANMKDITDPLNPVSIGGNSDLYVNMYDGSTGGQLDEISILYQSGSNIIYSSHWNGSATVRRLLDGGNIQVRTGSLTVKGGETSQSFGTKQKVSVVAVSEESIEPVSFNVMAYPNPTANYFTLDLIGGSNEKVTIDIFDMHGGHIRHVESADRQLITFGEDLPSGGYFAIINQGANRKTLKLVKK